MSALKRVTAALFLMFGFVAAATMSSPGRAHACGAPPAGIRSVRFVGRAARVSTEPGDPIWTFVVDPPIVGLESTVNVQISSGQGGSDCAVTLPPPQVGITYSVEAVRLDDVTFVITSASGGYARATDAERGSPTIVRSKKPIVPIVIAVFVSLAAAVVAVTSIVDRRRTNRRNVGETSAH
jgi:hypothetical protein